jgi:hypothetical protein
MRHGSQANHGASLRGQVVGLPLRVTTLGVGFPAQHRLAGGAHFVEA